VKIKPKTKIGEWSVGVNAFFILVIAISVFLVKVLGVLSFGDRWWDVISLVFFAPIVAFVLGIAAIRKKDNSSLVYLSVIIGLLVILFILLHSLFISD
jgi:hypothetical protein